MKRSCSQVLLTAAALLMCLAPVVAEVKEHEDFKHEDFNEKSATIDNPWWPLKPGTRWVWEGVNDGEPHRLVSIVTDLTKEVGGVQTRVLLEMDYVEGVLEEAEIAFFAQDKHGTIWHFGQYPEEYVDGKVDKTPGWLHGVDDCHAGIIMLSDPKPGKAYAQGWAPKVPWTDRALVLKAGQTVKSPVGTFEDVLVIEETDLEEPGARQYKYHARGTGNIRVDFAGVDMSKEVLDLIRFEKKISRVELSEARAEALKLDKNAAERLQAVFGRTKPAERLLGNLTVPKAGEIVLQRVN